MSLIYDIIRGLFFDPSLKYAGDGNVVCKHTFNSTKNFYIKVGGNLIFVPSSNLCKVCTEVYYNNNYTRCANCGQPICPGDSISEAVPGDQCFKEFEYIHGHCINVNKWIHSKRGTWKSLNKIVWLK